MKQKIKRLGLLLLLPTAILSAHADPVTVGDGTKDSPYNCSQVIAGASGTAWVKGYIVGSSAGKTAAEMTNATGSAASTSNIFIAAKADETDYSKCVPVQLPTGEIRTALNINANPGNLGKIVAVKGSLEKYFGQPGVKTVTEFDLEGGVTPPTPPTTSGDGSENNPYTAAEVIAFNPQSSQEATKSAVWVTGYIVGWADVSAAPYAINAETAHFDASATMATNILVAPSADVKDVSKCIGVQLPTGEIRSALNLQANPGNLGKSLQIKGDIMKYCGIPGIKNATAYKLEGGSTPTPTPTDPVASINENFDASSSIPAGWTQKQVAGDKAWYVHNFNENNYISMSGHRGTAPFDQWLISPPIIIDQLLDKTLTFDTQVNAYGSTQSALKVFVLTAADPTPDNTTQLSPNLATAPVTGYSDWVNSGKLDLSAFSGIIYIGFEYTSPVADNYATWCVDNVKLNAGGGLIGFSYNGIQFKKFENSDSCYVIGGGTPELVIPAIAINPADNKSYKVTAIGSAAFKGTQLKSITIPEGVTSIWNDAFNGCQSLTSVKMPQTLKYLGVRAFYNCSKLNNISLRNTKSCGNEAFSGCESLTVIDLEGMASIGQDAFRGCTGLIDIDLKNVSSLGEYAFRNCTGLKSVNMGNLSSINGTEFNGCKNITSIDFGKVASIGNSAFYGCADLTDVNLKNVATLGYSAFRDCSGLTSVTIPNSVTSIGVRAFSGCSGLTSVTFNAEKCTHMGSGFNPVFDGCRNLTTLTIGYKVMVIPNYAFRGCSRLTSVTIPNSVTSIGGSAFWDCSGLTSVTIPNSVTSIGGSAFSGCSGLTSVTIPNSVTSIGGSAFSGCSGLTSVTIGNSVTSIGGYAFKGCTALTEVDLNSVLNLGDKAFSGCTRLKSVSMLKAKSVDASVFKGCDAIETLVLPYEWGVDFKMTMSGTTQLRTLYIGENTASIPNNIFANNKLLFEVYSNAATPPSIGTATFGSETYSYATLYVPQGSVDAYKAATGWSKFEDIQELPFQIVVKDKKVSVDRTKSILVSASVTPASATASDVKWYSLNDEIATVTTDGEVTGVSEGGVTLLAYCDGITSTMKVIVKKFDGVEDVMADDPMELSEFDVYNLQGIRVRTNCTKEQLSELSHGIYILVSPQGRKKVKI